MFAHFERPLVLDERPADHPAEALLEKLFHRHAVAALHLVEPRRQHVVEVTRAVDVLKQIEIVWTDGQFSFEDRAGKIHASARWWLERGAAQGGK